MLVGRAVEDLESPTHDAPRELLQMPLNYLGMRLVRIGVEGREEPPAELDPQQVRAVGTWFESGQELPAWVWPWLERQAARMRVLHFGSLQPLAGGERLRRHLDRCGLGYDAATVSDPLRIVVEYPGGRTNVVPFESEPVYERQHLGPWPLADDGSVEVWLQTRDRARPRAGRSPVVSGAWGGIALQPWFVRGGTGVGDRRFYVDPFVFLRRALGLDVALAPAPDPSVRFGRRLFVLHVDGDGFESVSTAGDGDRQRLNAEVFRDRIIDRFQVPMTVSVIVASVTDHFEPTEPTARMELARELFAREWVEAASHSVLHPLDWRRRITPRSLPRSVVWFDELPGFEHDMVAEVRDSIAFIDRWLLPAGKRCQVMLWSGDANPTRAALAAARAAGCRNLNGDLFRFDRCFDSVGYVSPWGHALGDEFQVFAGAPNENVYDGFYTTMPGAFAHVDETLRNTAQGGRILKPANVYVHFYSAEHPARLAALERLLETWIERESTFPVPASVYAGAVEDCHRSCAIERIPNGVRVAGFRTCRTLRFDRRMPPLDWARCRGVVGVREFAGRTWVHLGAATAAVCFLPSGAPASDWPHVESSSCELDEVALTARTAAFTVARRFVEAEVVVAGWPPQAGVTVRVGESGRGEHRQADAEGRLTLPVPAGATVRCRCELAPAAPGPGGQDG